MNNIRKQNSIVKKLNKLQRGRNGIIEWEGIVPNISSALRVNPIGSQLLLLLGKLLEQLLEHLQMK